jgi:3D (Asp-Asp-Asp) domain-containing protein
MERIIEPKTKKKGIGFAIALVLLLATMPSTTRYAKPDHILIAGQVTAYSSEVGQTDSTPFHTANGTRVERGVLANNCLSFGTRVEIDGEEFFVNDRMNKRYGCQDFDIWFEDTDEAIIYGKKLKVIKIYGNFTKTQVENLQRRRE